MIDQIGNTPLTKSETLSDQYQCQIYIKEDFHNPGMSSKDRAALYMIRDAEIKNFLKPGYTIIEASSGNTGIGLALLAKELGYKCHIFMSSKGSSEKVNLLNSIGAEVTICQNSNGPKDPASSQARAKSYHERHPHSFFCNQYFNQANIDAHYYMTGPEIWKQSEGKVSHIIAGVGTGGTISGLGRYFKERKKNVNILGVDPEGSILTDYHLKGVVNTSPGKYLIEGIGRHFIPGALDFSVIDQFIQVSDQETVTAAYNFKEMTGYLSGFSSAAVLAALNKLDQQQHFKTTDFVVLFFADHGSRYISKLYNSDWLKKELGYKYINRSELT
ncbi:PLP-dependent cysteine synthase family protein [Olivibacter domesticus]|uniref:Cystathionine beta-synthase n=1 Tax=Olivibacter domesticus TaxID=407022 RepID=A0A1H7J4D9_OLID1|nr:cysteine synthase family protein [Olivibacter domesticus]SEK69599.1 cystathionine beta-synthase [Olivibacter domesticus]